jgi:hypothetical protein
MPDDRIRAALESRNLADRKDVRFQLLMGIPFSLFGLLVANAICLPLLVFLPVSLGCGVTLLLLNALLVVIIVID